eukprot:CAMPEP_0116075892 /NCGR_PEP_ID=MMETSP0322-20121206/16909_1 /TAXON_ID=163516 /ORGANISM="Leptocylindrus danicus var. apora, Strain B651" /LENGTH=120 /DNA_ID=CAMNT_0003566045 /DNA_START=153 /DNA_END=513 /DNA_ORIENTATION=+
MIVFDLDDCLWTPEMHTLGYPGPTKQVKGKVEGFAEELVIGMKCANGPTVKLFDGARKALIELATDGHTKILLLRESGVPYNEMLFFDDCNWGDHVGDVGNVYGVIGYRTPYGLQLSEFY